MMRTLQVNSFKSLKCSSSLSLTRGFTVLAPLKAKPISNDSVSTKSKSDDEKFESLSPAQRAYLDRVIRVDQAGELGANYIYRGQIFVLSKSYPHLQPLLKHMWEQEVHHHNTFNNLQIKNRVRPSIITPIWRIGAICMGAGTALISPEAAMACTEAVETVIGGHYNEQIRCLTNGFNLKREDGTIGRPKEIEDLIATIKEFRDDELEHLDTAIAHDSQKAVPYKIITEGIKGICKMAIWTAERI